MALELNPKLIERNESKLVHRFQFHHITSKSTKFRRASKQNKTDRLNKTKLDEKRRANTETILFTLPDLGQIRVIHLRLVRMLLEHNILMKIRLCSIDEER